ncbi:MAG TPA: hypothetical protein VFY39_00030 [Gammaproteobacteria bacterium]|nr:hypothetical protein [Gammaproteobacteria bacterium]
MATSETKRAWQAKLGAPALLVLVLGAAGGLLWSVTHVTQRGWHAPAAVPVELAGEHYRLDASELHWLEAFSRQHFAEGERESREIAAAEIDRRLDTMFAGAKQRLPEFVDWYYSLSGEYARMGMAALSAVSLAPADYVVRKVSSTLFPEDVWGDEFARLQNETEARLQAHESKVRASWLSEAARHLSAYRVPAPLPGDRAAAGPVVDLDGLMPTIAARERASFDARLTLSTIAAGGAGAGPALWRTMAARTAEEGAGRAAAERLAVRGAARIGSAAAGGAAVCSPSGPFALGCAVVAGTAAWVGTDWALLKIDAHLHRDELLKGLEGSLKELHDGMQRNLLDAYDRIIDGRYTAVQDDLRTSFVPADAGTGKSK